VSWVINQSFKLLKNEKAPRQRAVGLFVAGRGLQGSDDVSSLE